MRIITNTASSLTQEEGAQLGIHVIPVSVSIGGRSYRDYTDISPEEFVSLLHENEMPSSSQPSAGVILEQLKGSGEDTIMLTVADGLSGEYMTAMGIRRNLPDRHRVHIINSGTLAGPLRYMAVKAAALRSEGATTKEIVTQMMDCARSSISYVIPADLQYLRKSGRISNLTSKIGGALHLLPVLTQTRDKTRITLMTVRRTWKASVSSILSSMKEAGVDENYLISVAYADDRNLAERIRQQVRDLFPRVDNEILQLSPSLIAHGGPGCIVLQAVHK
ncbi:MAG: DegV family protein [Eubacteriales bacterium]|nr:DegV family protein [Eubacteriales bacterium]